MEPMTLNIPVLALRGLTVFPHMTLTFDVERKISISALERAMEGDQNIFLVTQREIGTNLPGEKDLYEIGTISHITQILRLSANTVRKAVAVVGMSLMVLMVSTLALSMVMDASLTDIAYETVSATATVGLSRGLTPLLDGWGKLIIIATMYFGRIGPISLAIALGTRKEERNVITDPEEDVSVG